MNCRRLLAFVGVVVVLLPLLMPKALTPSADASPIFFLPWRGGQTWRVTSGNCSANHACDDVWNAYAWDFVPGSGATNEVVAVADGTVCYVQNSVPDSAGFSQPHSGNVIVLVHEGTCAEWRNGVYSSYHHLQQGTAAVSNGSVVRRGTVIARQGNSGYSFGPHLHFSIYSQYGRVTSQGWQTVAGRTMAARFADAAVQADGGIPRAGKSYVSSNTPVAANQPPRIPSQTAPAPNSAVGSRTVTLQWQDAGDPDNSPRTYRDYYAEIWKTDNSWRQALSWTTDPRWTIMVPSDGQYAWHVKAGDGALGSDWSSTWTLTVNSLRANTFRDAGVWNLYSGTDDDQFYVADFDGDGKDDLVFSTTKVNGPTGGLTWYWMKSDGSRYVDKGQIVDRYAIAGDQFYVADFDGDGKDDIVTATSRVNGPGQGLTWYWMRSTGTHFEDRGIIAQAYGITGDQFYVADFDGDGKDDLVTATSRVNGPGQGLTWFWMRSTGAIIEDRGIIAQAYGITGDQFYVADFDGDGKDDVVTATNRINGADQALTWYWMRSTGAIIEDRGVVAQANGMSTDQFYVVDFDGDGKDDIVTSTSRVNGSGQGLAWFWMRSTGALIQPQSLIAHAYGIVGDRFYTSDFNGDGKGEIVTSMTRYTQASKGLTWFWMRSNGSVIEDGGRVKTAYGIEGDRFYPADFDGDGQGDLIVVTSRIHGPSGEFTWFWMKGTNSGFADMGQLTYAYGRPGDQIYVADFDGDAKDDIVLSTTRVNGPGQGLTWYWMRSTGTGFENRGQILDVYAIAGDQFYVADFDGDGKDDIVTATSRVNGPGQGLTWYWMRSTGTHFEDRGIIAQAYGITGDQFYVADFDGDSKDDLVTATSRVNGSGQALTWYWMRSNGSVVEDRGIIAQAWGEEVAQYFSGDFNGDGKDDIGRATVSTNGDGTLRWEVAGADASNRLASIPNTIWATGYGKLGDQIFVHNYRKADRVVSTTADIAIMRERDGALQSWMMFADFQ